MNWRYVPYAGFLVFTILVSIVRLFLMPDAPFIVHAGWFLFQYGLLVFYWFIIRTIARFLDKRLSYNSSFSARVFTQISVSICLLVPPVFGSYFIMRKFLPPFFTKEFITLIGVLLFVIIVLMNVVYAAGTFFSNWQKTAEEKTRAEEEKNNAILDLIQAKQYQTEIEMRALRAQMNPHFIFNSLNSINKYILKSDHANASRYLTRFAKLIRLILDNSNSKEVALSDELEALKLYIEMESLRFSNKFTYEIRVDGNVGADMLQVPPLIIQPYVENAIWHGLLHKESGGRLSVCVRKTNDNMLHCIVEDNGIGRAKAMELKSKSATANKSLGMKLTEERIIMLNKHSSLNASIQIVDLKNERGEAAGTQAILSIPI